MTSFRLVRGLTALAAATCGLCAAPALAQDAPRPNILVIMADDVGYANVGVYSHGMMVPTPNIDRIAHEGILFTDHYAQPSCTAGRASFITGQLPIRTGLHTVGLPGSPVGIDQRDPTLAKLLKELGYRTGQFGKNHLGDRNEHLPIVNGFDEFFGNLYHLNTEEEPELRMWIKEPGFNSRYRPRGVLYSDLQRRAAQLTLIAEVSKSVSSSLELPTLMENVASLIQNRFGYPYIHLFTVHPNRRMIEYQAGSGTRSLDLTGYILPLDDPHGIIPWVARGGLTFVANDVREDGRYRPSPFPPEDTNSELCVPLLYGSRVVGVLDIQSQKLNAFSEDDQYIFEAVADNIATAIHNADLYTAEQWRVLRNSPRAT